MATPAQLAEKARQDRPRTPSPSLEPPRRLKPPPLPPRENSSQAPPPYSSEDARRSRLISEQWRSNDPRSSSTHSLVPSESGRDGRRTLLLIYVHGFMGNETSFQSFPAHIHNLLTISLAETHVVHTKIYPRYKSRKAIEFARDDFSTWLEPHEHYKTDVILLGHSMGGILAGEVALQRPNSPATGKPFRHRILGTINFDTPFLGMHPGVVISGIGSLFRPTPDPPGQNQRQDSTAGTASPSIDSQASASSPSYASSYTQSRSDPLASSELSITQSATSPLTTPQFNDPFFNAPYPNDVRLPERKGWRNILHFVNKHSDGLTAATKQYFMSHLEFGGCLADYPSLKNRYGKLRSLEDVDELAGRNGPGYRPSTRRIRFINYYTASTGRPKAPKASPGHIVGNGGNLQPIDVEMQDMSMDRDDTQPSTPRPGILVEEHDNGTITPQALDESLDASVVKGQVQNLGKNSGVQADFQEPLPMRHIDSMPIPDDEDFDPEILPTPTTLIETAEGKEEPLSPIVSMPSEPALPPIPAMPAEPAIIDLSAYTDNDSRKIAEKEQKRAMKVYRQAVKDRESAIKDRKKLVEKREKKVRQEREKVLKAEEKQRLKEEQEEQKRKAAVNPEPAEARHTSSASDKPKRDKKFCLLPLESGGQRDKCWVRVYMEGVDEVGAHCGLFFPGPQYESLVGDVGARVGNWVQEDASRRLALEAEGIE